MKIGERIQHGANSFLIEEYTIMSYFIGAFALVTFFLVDFMGSSLSGIHFYATAAFILGSVTSMLCGLIGMKIAVAANYRTTYKAISSL